MSVQREIFIPEDVEKITVSEIVTVFSCKYLITKFKEAYKEFKLIGCEETDGRLSSFYAEIRQHPKYHISISYKSKDGYIQISICDPFGWTIESIRVDTDIKKTNFGEIEEKILGLVEKIDFVELGYEEPDTEVVTITKECEIYSPRKVFVEGKKTFPGLFVKYHGNEYYEYRTTPHEDDGLYVEITYSRDEGNGNVILRRKGEDVPILDHFFCGETECCSDELDDALDDIKYEITKLQKKSTPNNEFIDFVEDSLKLANSSKNTLPLKDVGPFNYVEEFTDGSKTYETPYLNNKAVRVYARPDGTLNIHVIDGISNLAVETILSRHYSKDEFARLTRNDIVVDLLTAAGRVVNGVKGNPF